MLPLGGRTISTDWRRLFTSGAGSPPVISWRWTSLASSPPSGRRRKARITRTRERSISADEPARLIEAEVHRDRERRRQEGGEQSLAQDDAQGDPADAEGDDDGGGQVDPAGGDERHRELGKRAFPEEDLADLEDDGAGPQKEQGVEAERPRAAQVFHQSDQP